MLPEGDAEAGKLVFAATVGCGCHFNGDLGALAGGNAFEGDFGVVNVAQPDAGCATGIADFTDEQLADAIRFGKGGGRPQPLHHARATPAWPTRTWPT